MEIITGKYTIKSILKDHWVSYVKRFGNTIPEHVYENVRKVLECREPYLIGYHKYVCPNHPDQYVIVPHSCKSRFCNSCGKVATDNWILKACSDFPNTSYFHITFTVPSQLRSLIASNKQIRSKLFSISAQLILDWAHERHFLPAITCVLHTSGRDLKYHPHIHMLISAGGLDIESLSRWIKWDYPPFYMIAKRWQTLLLYYLYKNKFISKKLKKSLFRLHWYVHSGNELFNPVLTTNYIGRYTKRPPLSEVRITDYDGKNVSFIYTDWAYCKITRTKTLSALDFIKALTQHIPPKHFKLIRHFGLLTNRKRKQYIHTVKKLFGTIKNIIKKTNWRIRQSLYNNKDPMLCPICQTEMQLTCIAFKSKKYGFYIKCYDES